MFQLEHSSDFCKLYPPAIKLQSQLNQLVAGRECAFCAPVEVPEGLTRSFSTGFHRFAPLDKRGLGVPALELSFKRMSGTSAPKGAMDLTTITASLKRCPDTKP